MPTEFIQKPVCWAGFEFPQRKAMSSHHFADGIQGQCVCVRACVCVLDQVRLAYARSLPVAFVCVWTSPPPRRFLGSFHKQLLFSHKKIFSPKIFFTLLHVLHFWMFHVIFELSGFFTPKAMLPMQCIR